MAAFKYRRVSVLISALICITWLCAAAMTAISLSGEGQKVKRYSDSPVLYQSDSSLLADHEAHLEVLDEQVRHLKEVDIGTIDKVDKVANKVDEIKEDISTMKGVGIGIGALLGFLQTIQVLLQVKGKRRSDDRSYNDPNYNE